MTFAEFLQQVGGMGRFQVIHTALLTLPIVLMASHNLLQNFTAAVPSHRCRLWAGGSDLNASLDLVPLDRNGQPEKCRRYVAAQRHLLDPNGTEGNGTRVDTETCVDGWTYDQSVYAATIVTEVGPGAGRDGWMDGVGSWTWMEGYMEGVVGDGWIER